MIGIVRKMCLPAVVSLLAVSCTSRIDADGSNTGAITFQQIHAETKAIVSGNELPAGSRSFVVWGWHGDGTDVVNDFESVKVEEKDSKWTYDGDLRFWEFGKTYDFYAVFPSEISGPTMNVDDSGNISITSFDCSKTGEDIVDLMTASDKGIIYNEGDDPQPVSLTFSHELARIVFVAKNHSGSQGVSGYKPVVHGVKLYGMYRTGDMGISYSPDSRKNVSWTIPSSSSGESSPTSVSDPLGQMNKQVQVTETEGKTVLEMLVFPQMVGKDFFIDISVSTADGADPSIKNSSVQLSSLPVMEWKAGKQYRYSFTITPDDRILFDRPTVDEWDEATGGIIIVD